MGTWLNGTWYSLHLAVVIISSQGSLLCDTDCWLLVNRTVLHSDVLFEWSCVCLIHSWLQHQLELARLSGHGCVAGKTGISDS